MYLCFVIAAMIGMLTPEYSWTSAVEKRKPDPIVESGVARPIQRQLSFRQAQVASERAYQKVTGDPDVSQTASHEEREAAPSAKRHRSFNRRFVQACTIEPLSVVEEFLRQGADVNARDRDGYTALMASTVAGRTEIVRTLLDHGADVDSRSGFGSTPLMAASYFGFLELARILIERGADVNTKNDLGQTALMLAVKKGRQEIRALLLQHGAR
jgi:ankyrin repeat protein